jgi:hypothetical protein
VEIRVVRDIRDQRFLTAESLRIFSGNWLRPRRRPAGVPLRGNSRRKIQTRENLLELPVLYFIDLLEQSGSMMRRDTAVQGAPQ